MLCSVKSYSHWWKSQWDIKWSNKVVVCWLWISEYSLITCEILIPQLPAPFTDLIRDIFIDSLEESSFNRIEEISQVEPNQRMETIHRSIESCVQRGLQRGPGGWSRGVGKAALEGCKSRLGTFTRTVLGAYLTPASHLILLFAFPANARLRLPDH